jgi:hypothetical protein
MRTLDCFLSHVMLLTLPVVCLMVTPQLGCSGGAGANPDGGGEDAADAEPADGGGDPGGDPGAEWEYLDFDMGPASDHGPIECGPEDFCPTSDTELSGTQHFEQLYIPAGVTVTCSGEAPLILVVQGIARIEGRLTAAGQAGVGHSETDNQGICGGFKGGDGFRECTLHSTSLCVEDPEVQEACQELISPQESYSGPACVYLGNAPGQPGDGPGGGRGGARGYYMTDTNDSDVGGGGGGGSYIAAGVAGQEGYTNECGTPAGGEPGGLVGPPPEDAFPLGGSGGGGGGFARTGTCGQCGGGCVGWGGDGGAGGGVIVLVAGGTIDLTGVISARGGDGGTGHRGGDSCAGSGGGGGSGGAVLLQAPAVNIPPDIAQHVDVSGGKGGFPVCSSNSVGAGGDGGEGLRSIP